MNPWILYNWLFMRAWQLCDFIYQWCMCVCVCVCEWVSECVSELCVRVCVFTLVDTIIYASISILYIHIYKQTTQHDIVLYMYIYTCVYIYIHIYTCTYMYNYTCILYTCCLLQGLLSCSWLVYAKLTWIKIIITLIMVYSNLPLDGLNVVNY